ncbi:MAG: histidine ammonia-lyase [Saprospiraceae bacterium]|jgi:histidine ammonia-lyase
MKKRPISKEIILDGQKLTPAEVVSIGQNKAKVSISKSAAKRVDSGYRLLIKAAEAGQKIYGLTVGVGENKDRPVLKDGKLTKEAIAYSKLFNRALIRVTSAGVGPEMEKEVVRGIMSSRLNSILYGSTGARLKVAKLYRDFLNHDIVPIIPGRGSMGEADITLIIHIGLAMIGEGKVNYKGKGMSAEKAMKHAGLTPLDPWAKDALAIMSSNGYSETLAAFCLIELQHLLKVSKLVFCLNLEALNGNITPFLEHSNSVRPFPEVNKISKDYRKILKGSYLWSADQKRHLQDPLSYRTAAYTIGAVESTLAELTEQMAIQLNSSDDNPMVLLDVNSPSKNEEETKHYITKSAGDKLFGAVIPTANFSPWPWVLSFEKLGIALGHFSIASAQRTIKLSDPRFTDLSRFLGTKKSFHAFGAVQKVFVSLAAENKALAYPVSMDFFAVAGDIEDMGTNGPRVVRRNRKMIDNCYYILGLELMHAAQAIDLRIQANPHLKLAPTTKSFLKAFRKKVDFMKEDRVLTTDIERSYLFLKSF